MSNKTTKLNEEKEQNNTKDKLNNGVEISSLTNFTLPVPIIKFIDKCLI